MSSKIIKKTNWVVVVGTICALSMILGVPFPYYLFFGITCFCMFFLAVVDITAAICLFLLLNPLMFLIRNAAPGDILLSGARSIWMCCLLLGWGLSLLQNRAHFPKGPDIIALSVFCSYAFVMAVAASSLIDSFLGIRSVIMPIALYFVVKGVVTKAPDAGYRVLLSAVFSTVITAVFSYFWYYGYLDARIFNYGGTISGGGGRTVLGYHFERMTSLIGGGPSNIGIFLGAGTIMCLALAARKHVSIGRRVIFLGLGTITGCASFFSLSRSVVLLVMVSLTALLFVAAIHRITKIILVSVVASLIFGVVVGTSFAGVTLFSVVNRNAVTWERAIPSGLQLFTGGGLKAPGGGIVSADGVALIRESPSAIFVDGGWPSIWGMMGLPGIISMLLFCWLLALAYYRLCSWRALGVKHYTTGVVSGSTALGLLIASTHTAVIIRPATDILFYALAAVMSSVYSLTLKTKLLRTVKSAPFRGNY